MWIRFSRRYLQRKNRKYKFVMYEDGLFLVVEGKLETGKSGLVQDPYNPDIWYFLANGQAQTQYTGLAMYALPGKPAMTC